MACAAMAGTVVLTPLVWPGDVDATTDAEEPTTSEANTNTERVSISRGDLVEDTEANGTVGYGDSTSLPIDATGMVTESPESGDLLRPSDELLRVADRPVTLAQGAQPLYRELRRVSTSERDAANEKIGLQTGADVEQLQAFLVDAGFDDNGRLEVDGEFGLSTERAVKAWQREVGHPATGKVDGAQLVFVDGAIRIDNAPAIGEQFSSVTSTANEPLVSVRITQKQRTFFEVGASVRLESGGLTATGTVVEQKRVVGDDGTTNYNVKIELDPGESLGDAETAKVTAFRTVASDVLTVPVRALVALAEGGWAVQVAGPTGPTLTAVELGDVVSGVAEISGLAEGTELVVPS